MDPKYSYVYERRANIWHYKRQYKKAIVDYSRVIELKPTDASAYYSRGGLWKAIGQYDKSIADYTRAIKLEPQRRYYSGRGDAWRSKGNYDKAIADYSHAIKLSESPYDEDYYKRGRAWLAKGDYDKSSVDFKRSAERHSEFRFSYHSRGSAWKAKRNRKLGMYVASSWFGLEPGPHDADAYCDRALYTIALGDLDTLWTHFPRSKPLYPGAISDYNSAIKLSPKDTHAYNNRGIAWLVKGDYDKAIADHTYAIKLAPKDVDAHCARANAWEAKGDYDKAIADYSRAIKLNPKHVAAYRLRGLTHFHSGKFTNAARDLHSYSLLQADNKHGAIWVYLACRRAGQPAGKKFVAFAAKYVKDRTVWPGPIFEMLAGRIDAAKCLEQARKARYEHLRREQLCEAYFYIAQNELIAGRPDDVRELLQKCIATEVTEFTEYEAAKAELKRMGAKPK